MASAAMDWRARGGLAQCSFHANASWATTLARDPDATAARPTAQLGACEPAATVEECCERCVQTLGCLAWTLADSSCDVPYVPQGLPLRRCCLKMHAPRHQAHGAVGCVAGVLRVPPCGEHCLMPPSIHGRDRPPKRSNGREPPPRPRIGNISHFPWLLVQQRQQLARSFSRSRSSAAAPAAAPAAARVAVCIAGTPRSLLHPTVWRSIEHHVIGRTHGAHSGGLDAFAVLSTGTEDTPCVQWRSARRLFASSHCLPLLSWRVSSTVRAAAAPQPPPLSSAATPSHNHRPRPQLNLPSHNHRPRPQLNLPSHNHRPRPQPALARLSPHISRPLHLHC